MSTISKTGQDWLTIALDPYHDYQTNLEGCPDSTVGLSYVRVFNQTVNVNSVGAGSSITVHYTGTHGSAAGRMQRSYAALGYQVHTPFDIMTSTSGDLSTKYDLAVTSPGHALHSYLASTNDMGCPSRLIGLGVEVTDTTSEMYKAGTMAVVHLGGGTSTGVVLKTSTAGDIPVQYQNPAPLPLNADDLSSVPNYRAGPVSEGCYVVGRMDRPVAPTAPVRPNGDSVGSNVAMVEQSASSTVLFIPVSGAAGTWVDIANAAPAISGFQPFVIYMSGLPAEGSYRVTFRTIIEFFPSIGNANLSIATPSPKEDLTALQLYHDAVVKLPAYVPVTYNSMGDFWRMVKKAVSMVAPPALHLAPIIADMIVPGTGPAVRLATSATGALLEARRKKSKPKPAPRATQKKVAVRRRK